MAHFAKIDENNVVVEVQVVPDEEEHRGEDFLKELGLSGRWIKTSYNTRMGIHYDPETNLPSGKPQFRKNFAGADYSYNEELDAFVPPKPIENPSFVIDPETGWWVPPVPKPSNCGIDPIDWNEETLSWEMVPPPYQSWNWNSESQRWAAPFPPPDNTLPYMWDENIQNWYLPTE